MSTAQQLHEVANQVPLQLHLNVYLQHWVGPFNQTLQEVQNERMLQLMAGCNLQSVAF